MFTVAILTKNSGSKLSRAIASVQSAPEIVIFDDGSTDDTLEIAKPLVSRVETLPPLSSFAQKRNWAMQKCAHDWVFFLDSDEELLFSLDEIYKLVQQNSSACYSFHRHDTLWGKQVYYGDNSAVLVRLVKRNSGSWAGEVHEKWHTNDNCQEYDTELVIRHHAVSSLYEYISKLNHYSTLRAKELHKSQQKVSHIHIIFWPLAKFVYLYFLKLGFLDGIRGLISAMGMSFYTFLVRAKLWSIYQKLSV